MSDELQGSSSRHQSADPDFATRAENSIISVQGLRLDAVTAPNIWGDVKSQPATINIKIYLREAFKSAATADALDNSTVHYGELAKRIRKASSQSPGSKYPLEDIIESAVGTTENISLNILEVVAELVLPKSSTYGRALSISESRVFGDKSGTAAVRDHVKFQGLRLMVLVGVNAYERSGKQPVVLDVLIGLDNPIGGSIATMEQIFPLERFLADEIEKTAFETLESLAEHVYALLRGKLEAMPLARADVVQLLFEKPAAIAFADAAVVQIRRRLTPG
nr:hypothetical protein B0A51_05198 [Rachicladosporium sp. CCFEE 5018]